MLELNLLKNIFLIGWKNSIINGWHLIIIIVPFCKPNLMVHLILLRRNKEGIIKYLAIHIYMIYFSFINYLGFYMSIKINFHYGYGNAGNLINFISTFKILTRVRIIFILVMIVLKLCWVLGRCWLMRNSM
jgi:hypothetical protein